MKEEKVTWESSTSSAAFACFGSLQSLLFASFESPLERLKLPPFPPPHFPSLTSFPLYMADRCSTKKHNFFLILPGLLPARLHFFSVIRTSTIGLMEGTLLHWVHSNPDASATFLNSPDDQVGNNSLASSEQNIILTENYFNFLIDYFTFHNSHISKNSRDREREVSCVAT